MKSYLHLINPRTAFGSPVLVYRVCALIVDLEQQGVKCRITKFLRKKKTAHRWSTAHHIVTGQISLGALRNLPNGADLDGNIWYKSEWDDGYADHDRANRCNAIKLNAVELGAPGTAYAEEGYSVKDAHRLPNIGTVPISKHVLGLAIDVLIDWDSLGGAWSDRAQAAVDKFGLMRPMREEPWHLELNPNHRFSITPYIHIAPHRIFLWAVRYIAHQRNKNLTTSSPGRI